MTINKETDGTKLTLRIEGSIDIHTSPQLSEALEGELENVDQVTFDLTDAQYITSSGLRVLLSAYQTMDEKGGRMILKNVNPQFMEALKMSGFTAFLEFE